MELSCNSGILVILCSILSKRTVFLDFFWRWPCLWNWSTINISLFFTILSLEIIFRNLRSRQLTTKTLLWCFAPSVQLKAVNLIVQCNEPGIMSINLECSWTGSSVATCAEKQIAALAKQSSVFWLQIALYIALQIVESFLCCASWDTFPCPHIISQRSFTAISFRKTVVDQVYLASFSRCMLQCSWTGSNIATCANCCISKAKLSLLTADCIVLQMVVFIRLQRVLRYFSNALLSSFYNVDRVTSPVPQPTCYLCYNSQDIVLVQN